MIARNRTGSWSQPLAELVDGCLAPALARHGFGEVALITAWPAVVGEATAAKCRPLRLKRPRRGSAPETGGTLELAVDPAFVLEVKHMAPLILERVNTHLGWRGVARLRLVDGAAPAPPSPPRRAAPAPARLAEAREATAGIEDEALRGALARLGARVLEGRPPKSARG